MNTLTYSSVHLQLVPQHTQSYLFYPHFDRRFDDSFPLEHKQLDFQFYPENDGHFEVRRFHLHLLLYSILKHCLDYKEELLSVLQDWSLTDI